MSDKPREWPNNARNARDRAAEEIQVGIHNLTPLVTEDRIFTKQEELLRVSRTLNALQTAARLLESVGAPTRPD